MCEFMKGLSYWSVTTLFYLVVPLCFTGCFTTKPVTLEKLQDSDEPMVVRIESWNGETVRGIIGPGDLLDESLRFQPLRYGPSSWTVRYGGWPIVYTAGKYRRYEVQGESTEIPLKEVGRIYREKFSWGLTLVSSPLTLPVGLIDFVVHHATIGFEKNDSSYYAYEDRVLPHP